MKQDTIILYSNISTLLIYLFQWVIMNTDCFYANQFLLTNSLYVAS